MSSRCRTVVLCLHGRRQDRHVFLDKCASLLQLKAPITTTQGAGQDVSGWVTSEGVECVFIDAPFALPKEDGDEVCMRTWGGTGGSGITGPLGGPAATAMIPTEYHCSVQLVLNTIERLCRQQSVVSTKDAIAVEVKLLGYSEGCMVATFVGMLLAAAPHNCPIVLEGLLLISPPAIPITDGMSFVLLPTLALIGEMDDIVPPEVSRDLLSSLFTDVTLLTHSGAHSVPSGNVPTRVAISAFMALTTTTTTAFTTITTSPPAAVTKTVVAPPVTQKHVRGGVLTTVEEVEELLLECECVASVTCTESTRDEGPLVTMFDQGERFAVGVRDGDVPTLQGLVSQFGGVVVVGPAYQGHAAVVLIPLLTKGAVREAAGDNVPPHRMKQLLEAGEFVVLQVVVPVPGYPYELSALSCTIAAGVPPELRRGKAIRAIEADALRLCREGVGSEMLLQLCMAVSDPILNALEEFYRNGIVDGDDVEDDAECHDASHKSHVQTDESRRAKLSLLWEGVDDQDEATREASISAGQAAAVALLSSSTASEGCGRVSWREAYSGLRSTRGGQWNITMGLVGKPSAGKSSFFNAATESDAAKVGAFPFTTIEPNIAPALAPIPCPCALVEIDGGHGDTAPSVEYPCAAPYGCVLDTCLSTTSRMRRHPVRLKDVAGLVKGAYAGRGKGNQFLNDLCDADVLIHIVDGVGATDAEGRSCPVGEGDPLSDVDWVRNEIHSWIFDNARAHWQSVQRRPNIFACKFSGYGASAAMMRSVLEAVGVGTPELMNSKIPLWTPDDLHTFVAVFIAIRFPMVVAVNKADIDPHRAATNAIRIAACNPLDLVCAMSARFEGKSIGQEEGAVFRRALMEKLEAESTSLGVAVSTAAAVGLYAGVQGVLYAACMAANPLCLFLEDNLDPFFPSQPAPSGPNRPLTRTPQEKRFGCCSQCFLVRRKTTVDAAKTSVFGFPANRKVVRCEGLNLYNLHPPLTASLATSPPPPNTATNAKRGHKDTHASAVSTREMYADSAPTVHSKMKEFDTSCILRVMTNSKGSAAR